MALRNEIPRDHLERLREEKIPKLEVMPGGKKDTSIPPTSPENRQALKTGLKLKNRDGVVASPIEHGLEELKTDMEAQKPNPDATTEALEKYYEGDNVKADRIKTHIVGSSDLDHGRRAWDALEKVKPTKSLNTRNPQETKSAEAKLLTDLENELDQIDNKIFDILQNQIDQLRWPLLRKMKEKKAHAILMAEDNQYQDLISQRDSIADDVRKIENTSPGHSQLVANDPLAKEFFEQTPEQIAQAEDDRENNAAPTAGDKSRRRPHLRDISKPNDFSDVGKL